MNLPFNQTFSGTCTGTALVLLMQLKNEEIAKTMILAALGALVSFVVSVALKKLLKYFQKR